MAVVRDTYQRVDEEEKCIETGSLYLALPLSLADQASPDGEFSVGGSWI